MVDGVPGRQQQHRRVIAPAAQGPQHRQAVHPGHHHVQDNGVVVHPIQIVQGLGSIGGGVHAVSGGGQGLGDGAAQLGLILGKQKAHRGIPPLL